jgi:hypothetical protein
VYTQKIYPNDESEEEGGGEKLSFTLANLSDSEDSVDVAPPVFRPRIFLN